MRKLFGATLLIQMSDGNSVRKLLKVNLKVFGAEMDLNIEEKQAKQDLAKTVKLGQLRPHMSMAMTLKIISTPTSLMTTAVTQLVSERQSGVSLLTQT